MPSARHDSPVVLLRLAVIPFFVVAFPAVHYLARNLSTERFFPHAEPSIPLYVAGVVSTFAVATAVSLSCAVVVRRLVVAPSLRDPSSPDHGTVAHPDDPFLWRVLLPDWRTLRVYLGFVGVVALWAVVRIGGIGPEPLVTLLAFAVVPFGVPLLFLAPLAIGSHVAVVVGYAASAIWTAALARLLVEATDAIREGSATAPPGEDH
ncbi:hypothetical protein [Halorubrum sp. F4]|uniref:hypothetical protein n=1 Tax=Halorubrum sp. F4 TaxID=2989715 RepID=UPI00248093C9|nr:hypothetical protein [Halorubrum sp. F4]